MTHAAAARVRAALEPVLHAGGYDVEDVVVRRAGGRQLVQVVVDRDGGVTLDDVAEAGRTCSAALDATDAVAGPYVLEVTSPGVDRPLTAPRHWRRALGRLVVVRTREGAAVTGRVLAAGDDAARLRVGAEAVELRYDDVARATVEVEFQRADAEEGDAP